jgi:hypothetical protein
MSKVSGGVSSNMLKGLKNRSPSCEDSSTRLPKGPNVASGATRDSVAMDVPGEKGGRTA